MASSTMNFSNSSVRSAILVEKADKHCPNIVTSNWNSINNKSPKNHETLLRKSREYTSCSRIFGQIDDNAIPKARLSTVTQSAHRAQNMRHISKSSGAFLSVQ